MLERAERIWMMSLVAGNKEKLEFARELNGYHIFSIRQIAKIVRMSNSALANQITKQGVGGRFNPESLTALITLRKLVANKQPLPMGMVRAVIEAGTSVSVLCRLTGAHHPTMYVRLKESTYGR